MNRSLNRAHALLSVAVDSPDLGSGEDVTVMVLNLPGA